MTMNIIKHTLILVLLFNLAACAERAKQFPQVKVTQILTVQGSPSPKPNDPAVDPLSIIQVNFNRAIDVATIHSDNVKVYLILPDQSPKLVSGPDDEYKFYSNNTSFSVNLAVNLVAGQLYKVEILADFNGGFGVKDTNKNVLQSSSAGSKFYTWSFTVSTVDKPSVLDSVQPAPMQRITGKFSPIIVKLNPDFINTMDLSVDAVTQSMIVTTGYEKKISIAGTTTFIPSIDGKPVNQIEFIPTNPGLPLNGTVFITVKLVNKAQPTNYILDYSWEFKTIDGQINNTSLIPIINSGVGETFGPPKIMEDQYGNITVFWIKHTFGGTLESPIAIYDLVMARYTVGGSWSTPTAIDTDDTNFKSISDVGYAIDQAGNITVIWQQNSRVLAKRYINGAGWETTVPIDLANLAGSMFGKQKVLVDHNGNVTVFWIKSTFAGTFTIATSIHDLVMTRYTVGGGWSTPPTLIDIDDTNFKSISDVDYAIDQVGNITVIWEQGQTINANRFE